jgi:hypothetical protein
MTPDEARQLTATLRWAADRIENELAYRPYRGRATRAAWAVARLRTLADKAPDGEEAG